MKKIFSDMGSEEILIWVLLIAPLGVVAWGLAINVLVTVLRRILGG